jgi:hippurate hydrolase
MKRQVIFMAALAMTASPASAQDAGKTTAAPSEPTTSAAVISRIDELIERSYPALAVVYEDLHAHPEVAFMETRSAAILASQMRKLGYKVTEHVGKTGVVALLSNGPGATVLVRTDLDGLPMEEKTNLPYASRYTQQIDGRPQLTAHSCGHDIHMSWWLGAAEALAKLKDNWSGTVMFVAQPAEETTSGARAMLDDGLFKRFPKPDYGFAAHVIPAPNGVVLLKPGAVTSSSDKITITFNGKGAHGSSPDSSIDPIVMGGHFVSDVQTVISREKEAGTFGVITIGSFQAGTVGNIIPDKATLRLTLRSQSPAVRQNLIDGVSRTAKAVSDMARAEAPTIEHEPGGTMVNNDPALVRRMEPVLKTAIGTRLAVLPPMAPAFSASEDFSEFVEAGVPSVYYWIGGYDPALLADLKAQGKSPPINHSPYFAPVAGPAIRTGIKTLVLSVLEVAPAANSARQ